LRITGTGPLIVDSRSLSGAVTSGLLSQHYSAANEVVEFIYPGDGGVEIRATFPETLNVEVI
jgi:hypothetical protein